MKKQKLSTYQKRKLKTQLLKKHKSKCAWILVLWIVLAITFISLGIWLLVQSIQTLKDPTAKIDGLCIFGMFFGVIFPAFGCFAGYKAIDTIDSFRRKCYGDILSYGPVLGELMAKKEKASTCSYRGYYRSNMKKEESDGWCIRHGNSIYSSSGAHRVGTKSTVGGSGAYIKTGRNTMVGPDGIYIRAGKTVFGPDGQTCTRVGNVVIGDNDEGTAIAALSFDD